MASASAPKIAARPVNARFLRAAGREAKALIRLATLLPLDVETTSPRGVTSGEGVAVLVHGSLATAGAWRPLRRRLEARGMHVATFTYGPGAGVVRIAGEIEKVLKDVPEGTRVHLVGHSLGGLAVRWYVQEGPPDPRIVKTISVAAPFGGARGAWFFPGPAGRDMQRGSDVLALLNASAASAGVDHLSILGTADTAVAIDTVFPVGDSMIVPDAGHNTLLFDEAVVERIVREVASPARAAGLATRAGPVPARNR